MDPRYPKEYEPDNKPNKIKDEDAMPMVVDPALYGKIDF